MTQASDPNLLVVPQTDSPPRSQSHQPPITDSRSELNQKSGSGSKVIPHARSPVSRFPLEDPSRTAKEIYFTSSDDNLPDLDGLEPYDTYDVPSPFIDRSFSLTLAYSDDPATDIGNNGRSSRGIKLKHYLKSARNNRKSLASAAGRLSRRSPVIMIPKTSNHRHRAKGPTNEGIARDKLATIHEFQKEF